MLSKKITFALLAVSLLVPSLSFCNNLKEGFKYGAATGALFNTLLAMPQIATTPNASLGAKVISTIGTTAICGLIGGCTTSTAVATYDFLCNETYRNEQFNRAKNGAFLGAIFGIIPTTVYAIATPGSLGSKSLNALKNLGACAVCGAANQLLVGAVGDILK